MALILDNASYHDSKYMRMFRARIPDVRFYFLPSYSPEFNPAEQVWKWSKPLVHAAKTINGGLPELVGRFRKLFTRQRNCRLANPMKIGLGFWSIIQ